MVRPFGPAFGLVLPYLEVEMTQHNSLILKPGPVGEIAELIAIEDADKLVADGKAVRLPDGIYREVHKVVKKEPAEKAEAEYTTKEMTPSKKATKKG